MEHLSPLLATGLDGRLGDSYSIICKRRRKVPEAVALLGDMAHARPREVVGDERDAVGCEHVEDAYARAGRLLRVGVVGEFDARLLDQQHLMVREIADRGQALAVRGDHEDRVPDGVAGRRDGLDARQEFLPILDEHHRSRLGSRFLRAPSTNAFMKAGSLIDSLASSVQ